jgi:hypothetical protein
MIIDKLEAALEELDPQPIEVNLANGSLRPPLITIGLWDPEQPRANESHTAVVVAVISQLWGNTVCLPWRRIFLT